MKIILNPGFSMTARMVYIFAFFVVSVFFTIGQASDPYLVLHNNGPTIPGSNITFSAHLMDYTTTETLYYTFSDGTEKTEVEGGINVTFTKHFSSHLYSPGMYNMTVTVKRKVLFVLEDIASNYTSFELGAPYLVLHNNGPAIRGSNITFRAHLMDYSIAETLYYTFDDGTEKTEVEGGINITFTKYFPSDLYSPGMHNMTVTVKQKIIIVLENIASNYTLFELSDNLFGHINVLRNGSLSNETDEVGTGENLTMIAEVFDGNGYLKDAVFKCTWSIDMGQRFDLKGTSLNYTYNAPGMSYIAVVVFATLPSSETVVGLFTKELTVKVPVSGIDISGNPFIHHDEVLNLTVSWTGTPPFEYCWDIINSNETVEGNFTCTVIVTNDKSFPVTWYFQKNGNYTIAIRLSNDVKFVSRNMEIVVFSVLPKSQLSTVIIPIVCSLLTLIIIAFGIAYYRQQRKQLVVEVASFDFHDNSDSYPERTFFEQLWDSFRCRRCCLPALSVRSDISPSDDEPLLT